MAIRAVREGQKISQEGLADASGIERAHFGKIERGKVNVSFLNLLKIAKALNTDRSDIVKRAGYGDLLVAGLRPVKSVCNRAGNYTGFRGMFRARLGCLSLDFAVG